MDTEIGSKHWFILRKFWIKILVSTIHFGIIKILGRGRVAENWHTWRMFLLTGHPCSGLMVDWWRPLVVVMLLCCLVLVLLVINWQLICWMVLGGWCWHLLLVESLCDWLQHVWWIHLLVMYWTVWWWVCWAVTRHARFTAAVTVWYRMKRHRFTVNAKVKILKF